MHLTNLLSTYYVPDMILDSGNVEMSKGKPSRNGRYIRTAHMLVSGRKGVL